MKVGFRESFAKDLKAVRERAVLDRVRTVIGTVEKAKSLAGFPHLKKLKGHENYYRLRIGNYRIGLALDGDVAIFVRCLNRKDIYKYFP